MTTIEPATRALQILKQITIIIAVQRRLSQTKQGLTVKPINRAYNLNVLESSGENIIITVFNYLKYTCTPIKCFRAEIYSRLLYY